MAATLVAVTPAGDAQAATATISRVVAHGYGGHVGIDVPDGSATYQSYHYWDTAGSIGPMPVSGSPEWARFEFYPDTEPDRHDYDPWTLDVGGVHIERRPSDGANWLTLGEVELPKLGRSTHGHVAVRIDGDIISATPVTPGRVEVDTFQIETAFPDPPRPMPTNANGVKFGAFSSVDNRKDRWTGGVGWPGRYVMFVRDTATGNHIQVLQDLGFGPAPTIDLDAICFGFDHCQYTQGGPGISAGTFHATSPTRILDTRFGVGISDGPVRSGGGRLDEPNPIIRRQEIANHELKVTGVAGVPESGVSAVLLNVTAVAAPGPGFVSITPKGPHVGGPMALFDDQASIPTGAPATSNLNVAGGDIVPNMVLARVGAGGKIRIYNWDGPTHMVADLAGWFGTGGAHEKGAGFTGVVPERVFDSRTGLNSADRPFSAGETRSVKVTGVAGVPENAASVVVNLTVAGPAGAGWAAAFPSGTPMPNASNLNFAAGIVRANLAVVKVGDGGRISLHVAETSADMIVDIMGSFGPGGGTVTAIDPVRLVDSRSGQRSPAGKLAPEQTVRVPVAGQAGIPADVTAVVLNVAAVAPEGFGYFTVWPHGAAAPSSSNVNYVGGADVPNLVMVKLGADGAIDVRNSVSRAFLVVDVAGYVR
jgi:hypothetical protein